MRRGWWVDLWGPLGAWVIVVALGFAAIAYALAIDREGLREDLQLRTELIAESTSDYVTTQQIVATARASDLLAGPQVSPTSVQTVVSGLGFSAGAVFDGDGRYIAGLGMIENPDFVGRDFTDQLEHLRLALQTARPAVSQSFVSPALEVPAVAIAVPYTAPSGQRVLTGLFALQESTLSSRVEQFGALVGSSVLVVDRDGVLIASPDDELRPEQTLLGDLRPELAEALSSVATSEYTGADGRRHAYGSAPIGDTGWQLLISTDTDLLYGELTGRQRGAFLILGVLAVSGLVGSVLLGVASRRRRLAEAQTRQLNRELEARVEHRTATLAERTAALEERTAALQEVNADLVDSQELRDHFLSVVAHEMGSPLTAIGGFAQTLAGRWDQTSADARGEQLQAITRQTERLSRLVGDLLTVGRLDQGRLPVRPQDVALSDVAERLATELGADSEHFSIELPDARVRVDPDHLLQILLNLATNALKYGDAPRLIGATIAPDTVTFEVTDHGDGVPPDFAGQMFERFTRSDQTKHLQGTGIGLSIVAGLAAANGGSVRYAPTQPSGATFTIELPRATTLAELPPQAPPAAQHTCDDAREADHPVGAGNAVVSCSLPGSAILGA